VCIAEERQSGREVPRLLGSETINSFIDDNVLFDLRLVGRSFTWYRGDGKSMIGLNIFLLYNRWCSTWPKCIHVTQMRDLSDHSPIVLLVDEQNWGHKPFRMLKCERSRSFQVEGWGGFVIKEKFKLIKEALKFIQKS